MKTKFLGAAAGLALLAFAGPASANITVYDLGLVNPNVVDPLTGLNAAVTTVNNAPIVNGGGQNSGTIVGTNGSNPFSNSTTYTDNSVGWDPFGTGGSTNQWLSIGGSGGGTFDGSPIAYATFNMNSPGSKLTFVWGSSSVTNTVALYSGANGSGSFLGEVVADGNSNLLVYNASNVLTSTYSNGNLSNNSGPGPVIEILSDASFSSAVLSTNYGTGGFEIGGVSAVPEPATWAMMIIGFAGVGFAGMRMRRKVAA